MIIQPNNTRPRKVTFRYKPLQAQKFIERHPGLSTAVADALDVRRFSVSNVIHGKDASKRIVAKLIEMEPEYRVRVSPRRSRRASAPVPPKGVLAHAK